MAPRTTNDCSHSTSFFTPYYYNSCCSPPQCTLWSLYPSRHSSAAAAAKSLQSCPTLCDPREGSPPGSPVPGFLQARTLEWVAISSSNAWKWKVKVKSLSCVQLLATPWTAACQAPPSMGFSRQEYWSGVPLPSPRHSSSILFGKTFFFFNLPITSLPHLWVPVTGYPF